MARERPTYHERIIQDPNIMVGKPVVKGTRVPVEKVLDQLAYKPDLKELFEIYPELTVEDVKACLAYAKAAVASKRGRPPRHIASSAAAVCGGQPMFRDTEKRRYEVIKRDLFSSEACQPGTYNRIPRPFCLADGHSDENLCDLFRDEAIAYFRRRSISWHDGLLAGEGEGGRGLPSNHLFCSQSACVNALWPMTRDPELLARAFSPFLPEIHRILPFEGDGPLPDGTTPFLAFEWIGQDNYLAEKGWGTRGANATSADFAFRFQRYDGHTQLVLGEWKYTECYGKSMPDPATLNQTRLNTYREPFRRWAESRPGLPPYETFFVEPFYQLMRLTLLAQETEWAAQRGRGEMGAEVVSVVYISPKANRELSENFEAAPTLKQFGNTIWSAWAHIAPPERFLSVTTESFLTAVEQVAPAPLHRWTEYLLTRYGWWRQPAITRVS